MQSSQNPKVDREVVSRALISLVADMTWADRQHTGVASLQRTRDEAISLLPKVQRGDHEAALRAMELVNAGGDRGP
jgi:hypothetical protein